MGVRRRPCRSFTMLTSRSIRHCGQRAAVALGANRPAPATHRAVLRPADQRQKLAGRIEELPRLIFFWPRAAGWRRRPEARLVVRKKIAARLNLRLRSGSRCALIETLRTCLLQWATRPLSKSTCPAKSPLEGGNTYGTRRTRSDHPERGANPGADAQPGRRSRARAGARRLCGAGRGPSRARGRAATSRGRAARVTDCEESCELTGLGCAVSALSPLRSNCSIFGVRRDRAFWPRAPDWRSGTPRRDRPDSDS